MIIRRATIRLTIQYSLVMLGIIALFAVGVAVYATVAFDLELPESSEGSVDQANATLRMSLIVCFAVLVLIVPPLSYLLARRTLAPVRANLEAQQRFVDDASHEFRTPIAVAQGELELALLHPRRPEEYRAAMRAALAALDELGALTDDLLLLAREDGIEAVAEHISIEALGERLLDVCPARTRDRVRVRVVGAGGFQGVPELVTRAAMNLVENAAKFSPEDAPIDVLIERSGDRVRIVVTDQGHGMSPEQAARAFDRFWRADTARSSPGRGIGLSIVRRIAELHGGHAILHSTPGAGTSATLELSASPAS